MTRSLVIAAMSVVVTGCASSGAVYTPRPFPAPGGGTVAVPAPGEASLPPDPAAPPSMPGRPTPPNATPGAGLPTGGSVDGYALSSTALSLRGAPYRNGGVDPSGFDCSGFVRYVYEQFGLAMPREVRDQFQIGTKVDRDRLEPGDLVFFSTVAPGASHVGIVIGGDQFVHAPSQRGVVRVEQLSTSYWSSRFIGAKRVS